MRIVKLAIVIAMTLGLARPAHAEGDPRPAIWEFLTVERYTQALLQAGVIALRDQVDFTYTDISTDFHSSTMSMHGLKIYPPMPWPSETPCVISAERATITGANPAQWDTLRLRLALYGATATPSCLPSPVDQQVVAVGMDHIDLNRFEIEIAYTVGPARLQMTTHVSMAKLAAVSVNLDFDYFSVKNEDDVVALLSTASVSIEDLGLWEKAKPMLPPEMIDPNAIAQLIQAGLTEALNEANPGPAGPRALPADQQEFVTSAVREVRRFVTKPGMIVIEAQPDHPIFINADAAEDFPGLFAQLKPRVSNRASSRVALIDTAKLRAAMNAPEMLSDDERRSIGLALITGVGAPKSAADGQALLAPMAEAGDGVAALAIAEALAIDDPAAAYRLALRAGMSQTVGATRLLDDLEKRLTTGEVLQLQGEGLTPPSDDAFASLSAMRDHAVGHLSGLGSQRSYKRSMFWASLAAATGDATAARIIADIEDRMRYRGKAAAAAWRAEADAAGRQALAAWLDKGLAAKFTTMQ
jgi:hypothetical protein